MPKADKTTFYAVHIGRKPGVYESWKDCEQQTKGYTNAQHKKFHTRQEAQAFVDFGFAAGKVAAAATGRANPSAPVPVDKTTYMAKKLGKRTAKADEIINESGWDVVYTDGACQGNGRVGAIAGVGVWWGVNDPRNLKERCPGDQTNNRAELIAIIRALETAPHTKRPLLIKTDSSYSISCVRDWMPSWRKRGWKTTEGKDVKNKPLVIYLSELLEQRGRRGQKVHLQYVPGHVGVAGNEGADKLAGIGASLPATPERDWTLASREAMHNSGFSNPVVNNTALGYFQLGENSLLSPTD